MCSTLPHSPEWPQSDTLSLGLGCNPMHSFWRVSPTEHNETDFWVDMTGIVLLERFANMTNIISSRVEPLHVPFKQTKKSSFGIVYKLRRVQTQGLPTCILLFLNLDLILTSWSLGPRISLEGKYLNQENTKPNKFQKQQQCLGIALRQQPVGVMYCQTGCKEPARHSPQTPAN